MLKKSLSALAVATLMAVGFRSAFAGSIQPFNLSNVRITGGPFKAAMDVNRKTLDEIGPDRALYCFRIQAGLPTKDAKPLEGWATPETKDGPLSAGKALKDAPFPGHFEAHYLSACALLAAQTGDKALLDRVNYMVAELAKCQEKMGGKYLFASPQDEFRAERLDGVAWYRMHKLMAGLEDAYKYCGNKQALTILVNLAEWIKPKMDEYTAKNQWKRVLSVEYGGMNEALENLYDITKNPAYKDMARQWEERKIILDPLSEGKDVIYGHANTYLAKMVGAARTYEVEQDPYYLKAVQNFWDLLVVTTNRTYATGGTSVHENLPSAHFLAGTTHSFPQETCVTYNMLKVARTLLGVTGDPKYADYYERALFNAILGSQDPNTGWKTYYQPTDANSIKDFRSYLTACHCCNGTGLENFAKIGDSIYFHDDKGIYVNLFIASELNWPEKKITLKQSAQFPDEPRTTITVTAEAPTQMPINIRVPSWCVGLSVKVNGKAQDIKADPGTYAVIDRTWKNSDTIEVELPMRFGTYPMPDRPSQLAFTYGPIVMVGYGAQPYGRELVGDFKDSKSWINNLDSWFKPVRGQKLTFTGTDSAGRSVTFKPYSAIADEFFTGYWDITKDPTAKDDGNIALGKKATASTFQWAMTPGKALDGQSDWYLKWAAENPSFPQWWQVDLGKEYSIGRCEIVFEFPDKCYKYKIESSQDGTNWTIFADKSANTTPGKPCYTDMGKAKARYLRVTVLDSEGGAWACIGEFRAFQK